MNTTTITIADVEALATALETEAATKRARLLRLIRAEARILAAREPEKFRARACEYGDEAGHYDNSYPPKMEYRDRTGPRAVQIRTWAHEEIPTSNGYYYAWRATTADRGLVVGRDGTLWGASISGTGQFGQFAAHPGDCDVAISVTWERLDVDDVEVAELEIAERTLRGLAFPLSVGEGV